MHWRFGDSGIFKMMDYRQYIATRNRFKILIFTPEEKCLNKNEIWSYVSVTTCAEQCGGPKGWTKKRETLTKGCSKGITPHPFFTNIFFSFHLLCLSGAMGWGTNFIGRSLHRNISCPFFFFTITSGFELYRILKGKKCKLILSSDCVRYRASYKFCEIYFNASNSTTNGINMVNQNDFFF